MSAITPKVLIVAHHSCRHICPLLGSLHFTYLTVIASAVEI
jgi:hypothetical protein